MDLSNAVTSIKVKYKAAEGWHVFTSHEVPGFLVAHTDISTAYNDISKAIELLMKLNEDVDCVVEPELSVHEFLHVVKNKEAKESAEPKFLMSDHKYLASDHRFILRPIPIAA